MKKFFIGSYIATLIALFLYSYTQIDLSLTFSRIEFLRELVKSFQYIGYFNRPLSTFIYVFLIILLFNFYLGFLVLAHVKQISKKTIWKLIITTAVILAFSYNAFSHDLFNYMFDAKIITYYHQNPYVHKALDFPGDPMLSYMHWTHRTYPYGPVWLISTVPLSFIGANLFIPTFFLFKLLMAASFLGTVYYIGKILQKINPQRYMFGIIFFAFNPLIIIESLVSSHIDIVMIFFASMSLYFLINKNYINSIGLLAVSAGIKFATAALLPVYLAVIYLDKAKKKINWEILLIIAIIIMSGTVIYAATLNNYQPWYLIDVLFLAALLSYRYYIFIPAVIISLFALFTYIPYLYLGNWDPPVPQVLSGIYMFSYVISILGVVVFYFMQKFKSQKNLPAGSSIIKSKK